MKINPMKSKKTNDASPPSPQKEKGVPLPEGTPKDKNNDQPESKPGVDLSQPWPQGGDVWRGPYSRASWTVNRPDSQQSEATASLQIVRMDPPTKRSSGIHGLGSIKLRAVDMRTAAKKLNEAAEVVEAMFNAEKLEAMLSVEQLEALRGKKEDVAS